jgi:hypothetical protein
MQMATKRRWCSWFWNIVAMLAMSMMAISATTLTVKLFVNQKQSVVALGFGIMGLVLWYLAARSLILGVVADREGIVVRRLGRTVKISWDQIESISQGSATSGPSGQLGATAPSVVWRRSGASQSLETTLDILGGYGIVRKGGRTLAESATEDLNDYLIRFRKPSPN